MIKISERLTVAASLVSRGNVLADVGTDHGYVPIYLVEKKVIPRAIAMDINRGPLERAKEHIAQYGMGEYIQTRLSDGVSALSLGEADTILIAGMGGGLVMHILEDGAVVCQSARELVLQPQSELERVRRYLHENGYVTDVEEMVEEEGKYYPMMRVHFEPAKTANVKTVNVETANVKTANVETANKKEQGKSFDLAMLEKSEKLEKSEVHFVYGQLLLESRHPVLQKYLEWERHLYENILCRLQEQSQTEMIAGRIQEMTAALERNEEALTYYR